MRGGFVACLTSSGHGRDPRLDVAVEALRWHRGAPSFHRHGQLQIACLVDSDHGPTVEIGDGILRLAHGSPAEPLDTLRARDRFVGVESDGQTLRAVRDPMGEVPLFYRRIGGEFWLATEVHPLLAVAPADPDLDWLAAFSAMVEYPDRTGWAGVARALPGEILYVDAQLRSRQERYFLPSAANSSRVSASDAAHRLRELLSAAVAKRCSERCGVVLSGGLDSSAVAVLAARTARPVLLTLSHPRLPEVDETRYAQAVADAAGIPLTTLAIEPDAWDPSDDIATLGTPPLAAPTGMYAQAFEGLVARGCEVALDGHDGDGTLGNQYAWAGNTLLDLRPDRLVGAARKHGARVMLRETVKDLVAPAVRRRLQPSGPAASGRESFVPYFRGATADRLVADLRWRPPRYGWRHAQLRALLPPTTQYFEETEQVAARIGIDIQHPFADRALIEFLIGLPHAVKSSTTRLKPLLREALADLLPEAVAEREDKTHFIPVIDARVDFEACYLAIRDSPTRLPDVDYGRLFRDATSPVTDRMLWMRLTSAHAFLAGSGR